jgi:putative IMPACT (imprinted ancient) family translation regulator
MQYAWRLTQILSDGTTILKHDNDDDGEDGAGSRLAQLLQHTRLERGIVVVVSRWFGGIHLGPKRFAHIVNAARDLLRQEGLI